MKRDAYEELLTWSDAPGRKPLLMRSTLLNLKRDARVLNIPLYAVPGALRFVGDLDARGSLG